MVRGLDQAANSELTHEGLAALGPGNACDTEPIHLSGHIQGHGVLLVVDPSSAVVTAASTNASRLLSSAGGQLGAVLADVIGADAAQAALCAHTTGNPHDGLPVEVRLPGPDASRPQVYDMVAHQRGLALVLELESVGALEGVSSARMYQQQRDAVNALHQVDSVQTICELTVERVRLLTGYDRVMIYRFAPDAHGQVIAEACATGLTPFLGLHYPATDIPRQARALFLRNWIRVIADVDEPPVPIAALPDSQGLDELDLSMSVLRSVSPMHLQYLRNMDVAASMTISLIVDNQLWGLIACHHRTPKRTGHLQRLACEALGQLVSVRLRAAQMTACQEYGVELSRRRAQVIASIAESDSLAVGAAAAPEALLGMVAADGAVLEMDGERVCVGRVPEAPELDALLVRLAERGATDTEPLAVDGTVNHGLLTPLGSAPPDAATGALYLPLVGRPDGFFLWLRGERAQTVRWAGRPDPKSNTPDALIGPRASFEEWLDEVRGHSAPWEPAEVAAAVELARAMPEVLVHRAQSQLVRLALHDPLTGLPNRTLMKDRLVDLLHPPELTGDKPSSDAGVGLLFIDLDGFKGVNDTRGHLVGDGLLVLVARRLLEVVRPQETVARIGGDEFVIVVPGAELEQTINIGQRVVEEFRQSFVLGEEVIRSITASVGVSLVSPGTASDEAIRQADSAMYHAKRSGGDQVAVYDAGSGTVMSRRRLAEDELRLAIRAKEITVEYQPIMKLVPGADPVLHGFEALARWQHQTRGTLRPGAFVAFAEESGLIDALGDAVMHEALRQLREWAPQLPTISVNVSVRQLVRPGFAAEVLARLVDLDIDPARLSLEVRESQLIEQPDLAMAGLLEVHAAGIRIGIDDFGTGGTAMTYLRDLPAAVLKIDPSLVASLPGAGKDLALIGAIVHLAHALGAQTVAKGVETAGQLASLQHVRCDFAQGYLLGEPMPAATAWLAGSARRKLLP